MSKKTKNLNYNMRIHNSFRNSNILSDEEVYTYNLHKSTTTKDIDVVNYIERASVSTPSHIS